MHLTKPLVFEESCQPAARSAPSNLRGLLVAAMLCSLLVSCGGGGGGSSGTTPTQPTTDSLLAVTNATAGSIDLFTIDTTSGVPSPVASSPINDGPAPAAIAIDPLKRFLYVISTSGELRAYAIDASLSLTAVAGSPFSTSAQSVGIAVSPTGAFVLTANGTANTISVFSVSSTGVLTEVAGSPFAAGPNPSSIAIAPGVYVYAANASGKSVSAYTMNETSGALTPIAGSPFTTPATPNGLVVDPSGTHLYVSESQPNEMSGFSINASTGALTTISGSPFRASYAIRSPVIDAGGKRLHISNGSAVDCYEVNSSNAALTEIGVSATNGKSSIALALDGPDNFLYVLDNLANQIEVFSIDSGTGALSLINGSPFTLFSGASGQSLGPNAIAVQH